MNLIEHLYRQREWSERTFGPGDRTQGVIDHIRKELREVEAAPQDVAEWIDVAILAFDGAWRAGHSPETIAAALAAKQTKNEAREWPDWRTQPTDKAIEHLRPAVEAYLSAAPMSPEHIAAMRAYLRQRIADPTWGNADELRESVDTLTDRPAIKKWLDDAMDVGIDPL